MNTKWLIAGLLLLAGGCLGGCNTMIRNQGSVRLTFGTQIGVESTSAKTSQDPADDGAAVTKAEFAALESWIRKPPEPEQTKTIETTETAKGEAPAEVTTKTTVKVETANAPPVEPVKPEEKPK